MSRKQIKMILCDIEGTTSSISFVHEVLFPYSLERLSTFLSSNWEKPDLQNIISEIISLEPSTGNTPKALTVLLAQWIGENKKVTPLKTLQGMIWRAGYKNGDLKGHLYDDAHEYLQKWSLEGYSLAIFSSGSIAAQKLLFRHSKFGDLTPLLSGYFDTSTGSKKDSSSYKEIASALDSSAKEILFLSDVAEELTAAKEAGMKVLHVARASDNTQASPHFTVAEDFNAVNQYLRTQSLENQE